jgi:hypothetical protein
VEHKNFTIIGAGATNTILDRQGGGRFLWMKMGSTVTLAGLKLQNGVKDSGSGDTRVGGAIHVENGHLLVTNSTFYNNRAGHLGGAIFQSDGIVAFDNCDFEGNSASTTQAPINISKGGAIAVSNCDTEVIPNITLDELGNALSKEQFLSIRNSRFTSNHAQKTGGP